MKRLNVMKKRIYAIIWIFAAVVSCTTEESELQSGPMTQIPEQDVILFHVDSPTRAGGSEPTTPSDLYLNEHFKDGNTRMRINVVPEVTSEAFNFNTDYKEYVYNYADLEERGYYNGNKVAEPNVYNFAPWQGSVLKWSDIISTGTSWKFVAAIFPRLYSSFSERDEDGSKSISADQSTFFDLLSNDLALAYHVHSDVNAPIELKFYHAFTMLECNVNIPVFNPEGKNTQGFTEQKPASILDIEDEHMQVPNTIFKSALFLNRGLTYAETVPTNSEDQIKAEEVTDESGSFNKHDDIKMCLVEIKEPEEDEKVEATDKGDGKYKKQCFTYVAILPAPKVAINNVPMLRFVIEDPYGQEHTYTYKPQPAIGSEIDNIQLESGRRLILTLDLLRTSDVPVLVKSTVEPWQYTEVDVPVFPDLEEVSGADE